MAVERMTIARRFAAQKLQERDDIIAVLVSGSTARGDALGVSDIDLRFVCDVPMDARMDRQGFDQWLEGVYLDSGPVPAELYLDTRRLLQNLIDGSTVYDAVILYDPTAKMAAVQREVREAYCRPEWVCARTAPLLDDARAAVQKMQTTEAARDLVTMCQLANTTINAAMTARIALACITPTSRDLELLSTLAPEMRERIIEVEGIAGLSKDEVRSLHHYMWEVRVKQIQVPGSSGLLAEYFEQKTNWMIENGLHTEAAHWFWGFIVDIDRFAFTSPQAKQTEIRACERWLLQIGWNVENVQSKVRGVREILREAETAYSILDVTSDK
jgi:hypothetical protein